MRKFISLIVLLLLISLQIAAITHSNQQVIELNTPDEFTRDNSNTWDEIGRFIVNSNYNIYILDWAGYGGYTNEGKDFIYYIIKAKAQGKIIVFKLTGHSYSMHSLAVCYATRVENPYDSFLMFHRDGYTDAQGYEHVATRDNTTITNELNQCRNANILSSEDIDKLWAGNKVYVSKSMRWYKKDPR